MNVLGYRITELIEKAAAEEMTASSFTAGMLEAAIYEAGREQYGQFPQRVAHRMADRIIQRERKAGRIQLIKKIWVRVTPG